MRTQGFAPFAAVLLALGVLASCGSPSGGGDGTGGAGGGSTGSGGAGPAGAGGTATGGAGAAAGGRGGAAGTPGAGGGHAGGNGGGAAPCGTQSCASTEICVHPSCGGGTAVCAPVPDGGQCPSGWTESLCPGGANRIGCMPGPCTPPAPFCAPLPASCGGTLNCTCLPPNVCGQNGGECGWIQNEAVMCGFA